jgi:bacterioferritin (cytochrome b1)
MASYRVIIEEAGKRGDVTTREMIEDIYMQEEDH